MRKGKEMAPKINLDNINLKEIMMEAINEVMDVLDFVLSAIPSTMTIGEVKDLILRETKKELIKKES